MPSFGSSLLVPSLPVGWGSTGAQTAYTRDATAYDTRTSAFERYRRRIVDLLPLRRGDIVLDAGCGTGLCFDGLQTASGPRARSSASTRRRDMLAVAAERVAAARVANVVLVAVAGGGGRAARRADHALFCAVHDVLQSGAALDNVLGHVRAGGTVRRGGRQVGAGLGRRPERGRARAARAVRARLRRLRPPVGGAPRSAVARLRVQEVAMGGGYLASGTVPPRAVPLVAGPIDRGDQESADDRADGTRG